MLADVAPVLILKVQGHHTQRPLQRSNGLLDSLQDIGYCFRQFLHVFAFLDSPLPGFSALMFILTDSDGEGCKKFRVQGGSSVSIGGIIVHFTLEFTEEGIQKLIRDSHGAKIDAAVELAIPFVDKAPLS